MSVVGIDFGTTNSVVATWAPSGTDALAIDRPPSGDWEQLGFDRVMPSIVARQPNGDALFGWAAKTATSGHFEAVKRLFATQQDVVSNDDGDGFAVEEVATMLFAELRRSAAAAGHEANQAVVSIPANSRGLARHRTKICAGMAGIEVLALINEPTAAAMAYALRHPGDQQILVFDWGGGTLDVTILKAVQGVFVEEASKGLPTKGGIDFDSRLRRLLVEATPETLSWTAEDRHRFRTDVELAKIKLSTQEFTVVPMPNGEARRVTRAMFDDAVKSLIEETRGPIEQCLTDIGGGTGAIDALVMVGGTSKIPAVRNFVTDLLGLEPQAGIDPMTAVGEGAALAAAILTGQLETNDFFVATEHALGTCVLNPVTMEEEFSELIPRNHKLPARKTELFHPVVPDTPAITIPVIEGDPLVAIDHPDNVVLKEWDVTLVPYEEGINRSVEITYDYDVDGILHVTVTDEASRTVLLEDDVSYGIAVDRAELVQISKRARTAVSERSIPTAPSAATDAEAAELLQRARVKVVPFLDEAEAAEVRTAALELEAASPETADAAKAKLRTALAPYSYLF